MPHVFVVNFSCFACILTGLLLNYNLFSQIADWRLSAAFVGSLKVFKVSVLVKEVKETIKKYVMLLYRRSVWWLYGWLIGLVDFNLTKMFLGILESCETGCNQWDIFKDLVLFLITKMLRWFRIGINLKWFRSKRPYGDSVKWLSYSLPLILLTCQMMI